MALLVAALPIWLGLDISLPRPLGREIEVLVVSKQLEPVAHVAETSQPVLVQMPLFAPSDVVLGPPLPPPAIEKPRPRPLLAVVGVGLQGLVMRSEPGGGERIRLVDEGADLRDLGGAEQEVNGRWWKRVAHPDGATGWVASEFLVPWDGIDRDARTVALLKRSAGVEPSDVQDRSWMQAPPEARSITPDQLKDGQTLSNWESFAACGPAAAVAFARAVGHDLTLDQAVAAARNVGWTAWAGIPGPRAELALLASLGIPAHQRGESEDTIDWDRVIGDVQAGIPVMVVTSEHYYVAEGYDPSTGKFDFGNSAKVLHTANKQRWFTPDELGWLGFGTPFTTIHLGPGPQPTEYIRAATIAY